MTAGERLGVLKHPGEAPEIVRLREGDERFIIGDVAERRPFNMLGTQQVAFDENFIAKGLAPNIMHPMYRSYCELRGPVVIVGVDRETRDPRSLEPREAEQVVAKLGELSITVPERGARRDASRERSGARPMIARSESPIVDAISHELRRPLYERGDIIRCLRAWLQSIEPAEADRFLAGLRLRAAGAASDERRDGHRDMPRAGAAR